MTTLHPDLQPIYDLELANGNTVARVDEPAGTRCPYAVVFESPLHIKEISEQIALPVTVTYFESNDPHYPTEAGFVCERSRHAVAGPQR